MSNFLTKSVVNELYTMLFYNKVTESEGVGVIRINVESSKQCHICHFYFFKDINFNHQPYACNGCHDASLHDQAITDIKIIAIKSGTYRVVSNISYEESTRLLESNNLIEKFGYL